MSLASGTRLGSFEIVAPLGAGGMGEVYRARDTRLKRDVALKVLPEAFAADAERLSRFEREARATAALDHPNILVVHEVGSHDGRPFVASELLEGETLREALRRGLSHRKALDYATQIATGLAAAHEKGIVHRDIKPENLFVTREGRIKILDFGLARHDRGATVDPTSREETVSKATGPGVVLGTAAYMSPEQVRGLSADPRSDIFSFGTVFHEMLSGRRPFKGETSAELLTAILREEPPDLAELDTKVPASVARIVRRCLEKKPEERFQSARDIAFAIEIGGPGASEPAPSGRNGRAWPWATGAILLAGGGIVAWLLYGRTDVGVRPSVKHLVLPTTLDARLSTEPYIPFALSPDGSHLVYAGLDAAGDVDLYRRALDRPDPERIDGAKWAYDPFFSPDGKWLAFWIGGHLEKAPVAGGAAATALCGAQDLVGGTWGADGTVLFAASESGPLLRVSANGGKPVAATALEAGELGHLWPDLLPGGREVLFTARTGSGPEDFRIVVQSLASRSRRTLVEGATRARYASSGHLVYARSGALYAAPFDLSSLTVTAPAALVVPSVMIGPAGSAQFSLAQDGTLAFAPPAPRAERTLVWVDRTGADRPLAAPLREYVTPRLSPDGKSLAVAIGSFPRTDIWVLDLGTNAWSRLTSDGRENKWPLWTPDGRRLVFTSAKAGALGLSWQPADGSEAAELLVSGDGRQIFAMSWLSDRRTLVFTHSLVGDLDLFAVRAGSGERPRAFISGPGNQNHANLSPDGRFVAYMSDESGQDEVYVQPFAGGTKYQVSREGGRPLWARNGHELFYKPGSKVIAVSVKTEPSFSAGEPRALFEGPYRSGDWDVAPDGRFLMVKPDEAELAPRSLQVVLNWFGELQRLAPVGALRAGSDLPP